MMVGFRNQALSFSLPVGRGICTSPPIKVLALIHGYPGCTTVFSWVRGGRGRTGSGSMVSSLEDAWSDGAGDVMVSA